MSVGASGSFLVTRSFRRFVTRRVVSFGPRVLCAFIPLRRFAASVRLVPLSVLVRDPRFVTTPVCAFAQVAPPVRGERTVRGGEVLPLLGRSPLEARAPPDEERRTAAGRGARRGAGRARRTRTKRNAPSVCDPSSFAALYALRPSADTANPYTRICLRLNPEAAIFSADSILGRAERPASCDAYASRPEPASLVRWNSMRSHSNESSARALDGDVLGVQAELEPVLGVGGDVGTVPSSSRAARGARTRPARTSPTIFA